MLVTKTVQVKWSTSNKAHYIGKGYEFTKYNEMFECKVEDLTRGSHTKIELSCDYCGCKIIKEWRARLRSNRNYVIQKDCCPKCQQLKTKECNLINFGVESKSELEEVKDKNRKTCIEKYGVDHPFKVEEIKQKRKDAFIKKYGVDNPMKNEEVIKKSNQSKIDRFGSTNTFLDESVKRKTLETNRKKYGCDWQMQNEEVKAKSRETMYKNGTIATSKQQEYLHLLFGGILNYPVGYCSLDIAFPNKKLYVEYNGNGHNLCVKLGSMTEKQFERKEIKRYMFLKSQGWKVININSPFDYLPQDDVLLEEFEKGVDWLSTDGYGHSHYNIDIGGLIHDKNYGKLRRIKEEDLS